MALIRMGDCLPGGRSVLLIEAIHERRCSCEDAV